MTRKKWNRLKRQRPELFEGPAWNPKWCNWDFVVRKAPRVRSYSKSQLIANLSAHKIATA